MSKKADRGAHRGAQDLADNGKSDHQDRSKRAPQADNKHDAKPSGDQHQYQEQQQQPCQSPSDNGLEGTLNENERAFLGLCAQLNRVTDKMGARLGLPRKP
jgi:hypothetical protein